jgi:hypothetical protein
MAMLISLAILFAFAAAPVSAATLQRTWSARLGSNGANGSITLRAFTDGTGSIAYSLRGLSPNSTYLVQIRSGTCASLGSIAARLRPILTTATGTMAGVSTPPPWQMGWIWSAARQPSFVARIVSGTSVRCGAFTFAQATRVAVSGLGIDLPVVRGPSGYPLCRVAMYLAAAAQPREPGITVLYAHARTGMFLPLLSRWRINRGASLIGRTVTVWTSDSRVSYYRINKVRTTTNALAGVSLLTRERLWLQTSTGPNRTYPKLIVEASRYRTVKTTYAASHPRARPVSC